MDELRARVISQEKEMYKLMGIAAFAALITRLLSDVSGWNGMPAGTHWLTNIISGMLLSIGLVMLYVFAMKGQGKSREKTSGTV